MYIEEKTMIVNADWKIVDISEIKTKSKQINVL